MNNLKLGVRLTIGFGLVLILTAIVALVNFWGLTSIQNEVEKANNASGMNTIILEMRREEKNFNIRGFSILEGDTKNSVEKLENWHDNFLLTIEKAATLYQDEEDRKLVEAVRQDLSHYKTAFDDYVQARKTADQSETMMDNFSQTVLEVINQMGIDLQKEFASQLTEETDSFKLRASNQNVDFINKMANSMEEVRLDTKNFSTSHDQKYAKNVLIQMDELLTKAQGLKTRVAGENNQKRADQIITALQAHRAAFDTYSNQVVTMLDREKIMIESARQMQQSANSLAASANAEMAETQTRANAASLLFTIFAILIGFLSAFTITRSITRPIARLQHLSEEIAFGNVDIHIGFHQRDELGALADGFRRMVSYLKNIADNANQLAQGDLTVNVTASSENDALGNAFIRMVANLRGLVIQVAENAGIVGTSASELADAADQSGRATDQIARTVNEITHGIQNQTISITQTAGSVNQMSRAIANVATGAQDQASEVSKASQITSQLTATIDQVASNADAVTRGSMKAAQSAHDGSKIINLTVEGMQGIKDQVDFSASKVREMGERSEQISVILETIEGIASQTNLLALNAAIEAARAGEHGKGFAVVADEVRKLAERSATATKEIRGLVAGILATVSEAVAAMDNGTAEVEKGVERANQSGQALVEILEAIDLVNKQAGEAASATEKMHLAANELVNAMDSVSAVVEENTAATEEMAASANEVTGAIDSIASISEENSAAIEEVSAAAEEMSYQVAGVAKSAQSLTELSEKLKTAISLFKLDNSQTFDSSESQNDIEV